MAAGIPEASTAGSRGGRVTSLSEEGEDVGFGRADVEKGHLAVEGRQTDEMRLRGGQGGDGDDVRIRY